MLTISEASKILGLSEGRTRALVKSGHLQAEKHGRQWMVYELSVEQRKAQGGHPGRPKHSNDSAYNTSIEVQQAYSIYKECAEFFSSGLSIECLANAHTNEERDFYIHMSNYFLSQRCQKLAEAGVY